MSDRLDLRTLNRTTLHRQHLLERTALPIAEMVGHLVGVQAQNPLDPYHGLWARLEGFDEDELAGMVERGEMVRGQLLRGTIHMVSDADFRGLRPIFDQLCARILGSTQFGKDTNHLDRARLLARARALLGEAPRTRAELGPQLEEDFPGAPASSLAQAATYLLPVIQAPPRGVWGRTGPAAWALLDPGPEDVTRVEYAREELVVRYLTAFGPASVKDMRAWSGLSGLAAIVDRVRARLRSYRDESGTELLDVLEGVIIDADTPAPPRFLPEYDNVLLGHADRSRFFAGGVTPVGWAGNLLVGGLYAGHWRVRGKALTLALQRRVTSRQRREVTEEAELVATRLSSRGKPGVIEVILTE
jgi:hypothetical protein